MRTVFLLLTALLGMAFAADKLAGVYVGKWSGASGAAGDFRISLTAADGKLTPDVMFTMGSTEVKTKVTHFAVNGMKLEMKYEFDLNGVRLESTLRGTLSGEVLEGRYSTKSVVNGSAADEGEWKATRQSN